MDDQLKKMFRPAFTRYKLMEYKKKKVQLIDLVIKENNRHLESFLNSLLPKYEARLFEMLGYEKNLS
ncbi:hypothetical protein QWY86_15250 [Pedobacter aquatilis]|nr:hypothetical protein [Pedobacter aquatilis]